MVAGDNKWLNPTQEIQEVQKGKRRTAVSRGKRVRRGAKFQQEGGIKAK